MYPLKLHRSAMAPDTMVAHVAAKVLCVKIIELQTKVCEDFTVTEKAFTRAFSWMKAPTSASAFKTQC